MLFYQTFRSNENQDFPWSYIREAGVRGRFCPALLQVVSPVEVLAFVASGPLQTHAILQTPLDGQNARRVGVTHDRLRLRVKGEIIQRYLEVDVVVDLKRTEECLSF